jgi:hypothetical protein
LYVFIFLHAQENEPKEGARAPLILRVTKPNDETAPNAAMLRCKARSGAHNQSIARRLALPCALPDGMMLVSLFGFSNGARRNALRSNRPTRLFRSQCRCSARDKGRKSNSKCTCPYPIGSGIAIGIRKKMRDDFNSDSDTDIDAEHTRKT